MSEDAVVAAWIAGRRKQGRGEGEGAAYKPWLTVRDFSSRGVSHRVKGRNGRTYHLLSTLEYDCFLLLEWSDAVVDLREQFPLHEVTETQAIAADLGYAHPAWTRRVGGRLVRRPEPMTTDFLATLADVPGLPPFVALSVKPVAGLEGSPGQVDRVLEKLEIERRYWARRGVPFRVVTELEMPQTLVANLKLVLPCRGVDPSEFGVDATAVAQHLEYLYDQVIRAPEAAICRVCADADARFELRVGTCLTLVWHAVASKQWAVDMHTPLSAAGPLHGLRPGAAASGAAPRPAASVALLRMRHAGHGLAA